MFDPVECELITELVVSSNLIVKALFIPGLISYKYSNCSGVVS